MTMFAADPIGEALGRVSAERRDDETGAPAPHLVVPEHWHAEVGLAGNPTSAREARTFVREVLTDRVPPATIQDVLLVASEMVSNVIRHARTPLTLGIEVHNSHVRLSVTDGEPPFGAVGSQADDAESGRGMGIIGSLSQGWGIGDTPMGKSIWAEIPIA